MIATVKRWAPNHSAPSKHSTVFNFNNFVAAQEELPPSLLLKHFVTLSSASLSLRPQLPRRRETSWGHPHLTCAFLLGRLLNMRLILDGYACIVPVHCTSPPQTKLSVFNCENVSVISSLSHLNVDLIVRFQILSTLSCEINFVNSKFYAHKTVRSVSHAPTK